MHKKVVAERFSGRLVRPDWVPRSLSRTGKPFLAVPSLCPYAPYVLCHSRAGFSARVSFGPRLLLRPVDPIGHRGHRASSGGAALPHRPGEVRKSRRSICRATPAGSGRRGELAAPILGVDDGLVQLGDGYRAVGVMNLPLAEDRGDAASPMCLTGRGQPSARS